MTFGRWQNPEPDYILPAENPPVAPALRLLLDERPDLMSKTDAHDFALRLWLLRYLPYPPKDAEVREALARLAQEEQETAA